MAGRVRHPRAGAAARGVLARRPLVSLWEKSLRDGAATLGTDSPAGARVAETAAFFEFLQGEMLAMMDRWRDHREKLGLG
ncbi:hypothetical protein [Streptomyces sp. NRRL F-2580]|uniref:hypothetical protein n=1 Tax=Streptomyces sp. NRRL F-2580 TaxID=1463841 RepID=UPI00099B9C14|nr:hypothetical protein [Streptomyces sp. NRRL F-2580]